MKSTKKFVALFLCAAMVLTSTACGGARAEKPGAAKASSKEEPIALTLLSRPNFEVEANTIRDQLTKAGFDVTVNIQPDRASFVAVQETGNYDLAILNWLTDAAAPDYAVRQLYHNDGSYNDWPIKDDELSAMIDEAAQLTFEDSIPLYTDIENRLVDEKCWIVPLYNRTRFVAVNNEVVVPESIFCGGSTPRFFGMSEYVDKSLSETRPYVPVQFDLNPPTFDPIRSEEGSTFWMKANSYISLTACNANDEVVPDYSLSRAFAIGEGNDVFYFMLRDDVNFAKVEDNKAVDTGVLVSAEDVVYTLERAKDPDAVPLNSGYSNLEAVDTIEILTDMEELKNINVSGSSQSVFDYFNEKAPAPIEKLTEVTDEVDNAAGVCQVVKITTTKPNPQLLNFLTISTLGIVSKEVVSSINEGIDASNYDPSKDVLYGDVNTLKQGSAQFNNNNWFSGPYAMLYINDYEMAFERNPGFMPDTEWVPKIKYLNLKMMGDMNTAYSALRSGEIDDCMPEGSWGSLRDASNVSIVEKESTSVSTLFFNLAEGSKMNDINLRQAVRYAISQDDLIAVKEGTITRAHSTLSMIPTGNEWNADLEKSAQYLQAYRDSQKQ